MLKEWIVYKLINVLKGNKVVGLCKPRHEALVGSSLCVSSEVESSPLVLSPLHS